MNTGMETLTVTQFSHEIGINASCQLGLKADLTHILLLMSYSSHLCPTCDVLRIQLKLKEDQLKAKEDQLKAKEDKICQLQETVIQTQRDLIAAKEETLMIKGLHELTLSMEYEDAPVVWIWTLYMALFQIK